MIIYWTLIITQTVPLISAAEKKRRLLEILINSTFHRVGGYIVGIPKTEFEYYRQSLICHIMKVT